MKAPMGDANVSCRWSSKTAYCVVYVCPLYVSATTRPSPTRSRDAPDTIRRRIRAVSLSTIACSIITILLLHHLCDGDGDIAAAARASWPNPLRLMGYWPVGIVDAAKATVLTALLFAGPLYECLLIDGAWRQWLSRLQPLHMVWTDWPTWRNMVAVCSFGYFERLPQLTRSLSVCRALLLRNAFSAPQPSHFFS